MTLLSSDVILRGLCVFLGVAILDIMWAWYVRHTANNNAWRASLTAVGLTIFGAGLTLEYVENRWMLIPAGLGAFAGTFIPLRWFHDAPEPRNPGDPEDPDLD